ncbi:TetR family transcriptional regulator C-terminal domain-containing protein [Flavobacterium flavipallidum]|uniref:TetR family transcriptional regulator C-terminal domain-containing protein n=1 Tax=Flavobacterium flavipallidum TaxID=3139140 RepID=A0ABU9HNB1_9FLAO
MATKKTSITKESIVSQYMNSTLENNERPQSVYLFAKKNGFTEAEFYNFFGNLESIEKEIYVMFLEKTIELIHKDSNYESYDMKSKLLSFYFTFFELLAANRSYVIMSLNENKNQLKNLLQLSGLRTAFKKFIDEITTDEIRIQQEKIKYFQEKAIQESAWIQLLFTLKFWLEDGSPNFEKTDVYIEKSVKLSFELMNAAPINSLIDFGKFIFKEKMQNNS